MLWNKRLLYFLGFTAIFGALAGFVFWGTWSLDVVPVMPDCPTTFPADQIARSFRDALETGRFIPLDLVNYVGSPYLWIELKYVLCLYLAALGMAYFCRGRGLSRLASCGAGLLLAFCGYWMTLFSAGHFGWFQWMAHGVFAFGLADRAVRKDGLRHWLLLGAVVSWASFNQQDLWLLFTVFTTAYFLWCCFRERKFPWKGMLIAAAAFVLIGLPNIRAQIAGGAIQGRKEQIAKGENVSNKGASEAEKRWEFVTNWSMPPGDTLEFFDSRAHGDTSCPFVLSINRARGVRPYEGALGRPMNAKQGNYRQHSLYVGWVTCLLALLGLVCAFSVLRKSNDRAAGQSGNNSDALFFAVAALVFYLLSLGRYFEPAYRIVFSLPLGDLIRCPVKWHHLTEFCLVVLAGYGIDWSVARLGRLKNVGRFAPLAIGLLVFVGVADLAGEAKRFCAPVSVKEARRTNSMMQLTILSRQQFQNPQVAAMVQAGRIVSIANYMGSPEHFVVGVLDRAEPRKDNDISTLTLIFGLLSLASTLGIAICCVSVAARPRNVV